MDPLDIFSVRDLRQRSGKLLKDAENGRLALITKHGRPAILAVPFDERLLDLGLHRTLALRLFEKRHLTLVQAAKLAGLSAEEFLALLGEAGIPAADYPAEELDEEVGAGQRSAPVANRADRRGFCSDDGVFEDGGIGRYVAAGSGHGVDSDSFREFISPLSMEEE